MIKDVPGWEGKFAVSSEGRIWSYWKKDWLALHNTKSGDWYQSVSFGTKTANSRKGYKVHRLVAQAFIPNPKGLKEVNHKNGIKTDNRAENLEWCTRKENLQHASRNGWLNPKRGEDNWRHKLTSIDVENIKILLRDSRYSMRELGRKFHVASPTIQGINRGVYWAHILQDIPTPIRST